MTQLKLNYAHGVLMDLIQVQEAGVNEAHERMLALRGKEGFDRAMTDYSLAKAYLGGLKKAAKVVVNANR